MTMKVVIRAYDDNTADILDLDSMRVYFCTEHNLKTIDSNDVLGLSVTKGKINYINAYDYIQFETDDELEDYIVYNRIRNCVKKYINGTYFLFIRNDSKIHVDYYVCTYRGPVTTYVCTKGYTIYINGAKKFNKTEASKRAAIMTDRSRTGSHWFAVRTPVA